MSKKIITKNQFLKINKSMSLKMSKDISLQKDAIKIFTKADKLRWVHQALWMGEPVLNLPQDMFAINNLFNKTRLYNRNRTSMGRWVVILCNSIKNVWWKKSNRSRYIHTSGS